jgi:hypothetical protein
MNIWNFMVIRIASPGAAGVLTLFKTVAAAMQRFLSYAINQD